MKVLKATLFYGAGDGVSLWNEPMYCYAMKDSTVFTLNMWTLCRKQYLGYPMVSVTM